MNCESVQSILRTKKPSSWQSNSEFIDHCVHCEHCKDLYQNGLLKHGLSLIDEVPHILGVEDRILSKIRTNAPHLSKALNQEWKPAKKKPKPSLWQQPLAWSMAASFLVFGILIQLLIINPMLNHSGIQSIEIAAGELQTVNLVLNSGDDYTDAFIEISTSENLSLDPNGKIKNIGWHTDLKFGNNVLPLPMLLMDSNQGHIELVMSTGQHSQSFRFNVKASNPMTTKQRNFDQESI